MNLLNIVIYPFVKIKYSLLFNKKADAIRKYVFNCYDFTSMDVTDEIYNAYVTHQEWINGLAIIPTNDKDIHFEHNKWIISHIKDIDCLYKFSNEYIIKKNSFINLNNKYPDAIKLVYKLENPNYSDMLRILNIDEKELSVTSGIKPQYVKKIKEALESEDIFTMSQLLKVSGIGENTVEKAFKVANELKDKNISKNVQLSLPL